MSFSVRNLRDEPAPPRSSWKPSWKLLLSLSGPVLTIGRILRQNYQKKKEEEARLNLLKRIIVILIAVFCGVLVLAVTVKALVSLQILSISSFVNVAGSDLPVDRYGHTNILLLGQGDESHDGVDLTDTIMIASLDPQKTRSAVLLSLPRDLYFLETEKMGKGRINSLYRDYKLYLINQGASAEDASREALQELSSEIGKALNMSIHRVVKVDFIGFIQAVDAIGGIDIEVPSELIDTEYPGPNYTYETFSIPAGLQHIDGETALKYARSRHSTSDFDRSARQQQILRAIAEKIRNEGTLTSPRQITQLMNILSEHVETTLAFREMVGLAGLAEEIDQSKIMSVQINDQNGLYGAFSEAGGLLYTPPRADYGGAAVLLPVSVPEYPVTWDRVRLLIDMLIHDRVHAENAPVTILNAGAEPGSARRLGGELIRFGFNVVAMENAPDDFEQPEVTMTAEQSQTAFRISELFEIPLTVLPSPMSSSSASSASSMPLVQPVTIYLGEDYVYTPAQIPSESSDSPTE